MHWSPFKPQLHKTKYAVTQTFDNRQPVSDARGPGGVGDGVWGMGGLEPSLAVLTVAGNEKYMRPVGQHLWSQLSAVVCNSLSTSELMIHFTQPWHFCGRGAADTLKAGSCPALLFLYSFWVMICSRAINQDCGTVIGTVLNQSSLAKSLRCAGQFDVWLHCLYCPRGRALRDC